MKKSLHFLLSCMVCVLIFFQQSNGLAEVRFYSVEEPVQEEGGVKNDENEKKEDQDVLENDSVIFPNGGEILLIGNEYDIIWSFNGSVQSVSIYFSTDRGLSWSVIEEETVNDGRYKWIVPPVKSGDCLIKISNAEDEGSSDMSNGFFTISPVPFQYRIQDGP